MRIRKSKYRYIPDFYLSGPPGAPHLLGPNPWHMDMSGFLPRAVYALYGVHGAGPPTPEQLEACREYCDYYINAPCWDLIAQECGGRNPEEAALWDSLRERIKQIKAREELLRWLEDAIEVTIDPF